MCMYVLWQGLIIACVRLSEADVDVEWGGVTRLSVTLYLNVSLLYMSHVSYYLSIHT